MSARKEISNRRFDKYINFSLTICTAFMFAFESFSLQSGGGWQRSDCECLHTQPLQFCVWNDIIKWNTLSMWYTVDSFDMCWITGRVFEFVTKIELITIAPCVWRMEFKLRYNETCRASRQTTYNTAIARENYHHQTSSSSRAAVPSCRMRECRNISLQQIYVSREHEIDEFFF